MIVKTVHDRITRDDVTEELRIYCACCLRDRPVRLVKHPSIPDHPGGVKCAVCGSHIKWLAKPESANKRPPAGDMDEVWKRYGNHCACCGLSVDEMKVLGLHRTMQHVPPYSEGGTDLIPFCSWCQQKSASDQVRLKALVKRLAKQMSMPDVEAA